MSKFTAHTVVHSPDGPQFFAPGDELPEWAAGLVGAHVLDSESPTVVEQPEDEDVADAEPEADAEQAQEAPDFTAPKRQTRQRRS